jgi:rhodanese-related sulfurtransferase
MNQTPISSATETILAAAHAKGRELGLSYAGAVTPQQAFALTQSGSASIVDVRSRFEYEFVGRITGSELIEWRIYDAKPEGGIASRLNSAFLEQLKAQYKPDETLLLLCRSAVRSHQAAEAAHAAGYTKVYNILEGFEGDKDAGEQRGHAGGWRHAGLPWVQG